MRAASCQFVQGSLACSSWQIPPSPSSFWLLSTLWSIIKLLKLWWLGDRSSKEKPLSSDAIAPVSCRQLIQPSGNWCSREGPLNWQWRKSRRENKSNGVKVFVSDEIWKELQAKKVEVRVGNSRAAICINVKTRDLARWIMDAQPAVVVDPINQLKLDNTLLNLRLTDYSANSQNRRTGRGMVGVRHRFLDACPAACSASPATVLAPAS